MYTPEQIRQMQQAQAGGGYGGGYSPAQIQSIQQAQMAAMSRGAYSPAQIQAMQHAQMMALGGSAYSPVQAQPVQEQPLLPSEPSNSPGAQAFYLHPSVQQQMSPAQLQAIQMVMGGEAPAQTVQGGLSPQHVTAIQGAMKAKASGGSSSIKIPNPSRGVNGGM
jgi:hypothetical protein